MPRATIPDPDALIAALARNGVDIRNVIGIQAEHRMYDRREGNFKAVGWVCTVRTFDRLTNTNRSFEIGIVDADIRPTIQIRL